MKIEIKKIKKKWVNLYYWIYYNIFKWIIKETQKSKKNKKKFFLNYYSILFK